MAKKPDSPKRSAERNQGNNQESNPTTDVVIVGAGPTGLMAAGLLARCGVRVRLLEKTGHGAKESRAFGIQAKSMELFLNMGIVDRFLETCTMATGAQVFVDGKKAGELNFDDIGSTDTPYSFFTLVPQSKIESLLEDDLQQYSVVVERGVDVDGFEQDARGVTVKTKTGTIQCRYLIGADGAHSIVRETLGLEFAGAPYNQGFLLADCRIDWSLDHDHVKIFMYKKGFALYMPLKGQAVGRVIVGVPMNENLEGEAKIAATSTPVSLEEVERDFRSATGLDVKLSNPVWTSRYRIHHRAVKRYGVGRVFVAGDAAHIHSPAGGQGMNTGLQDAANLAWKIALSVKGTDAATALLETYHLERWPVGQKILEFTDKLFSAVTAQSSWAAGLRNRLVPFLAPLLTGSELVRRRAFRFISQVGIRYHGNDFLSDDVSSRAPKSWREGLKPGRRAPNGALARHLDIFDLLQGYCFHVLIFSHRPLPIEEIAGISVEADRVSKNIGGLKLKTHFVAASLSGVDERIVRPEASEAFARYGVSEKVPQAIFLIRPDGYIAYRSDRLNFAGLISFLEKFQRSEQDHELYPEREQDRDQRPGPRKASRNSLGNSTRLS